MDKTSVAATTEQTPVVSWHTIDVDSVVQNLKTDQSKGISQAEALQRLNEVGANEVSAGENISTWSIFLSQFKNILIVILIAAVVLSMIMGHAVEAIAISAILLFAVILGFLQ